MLAIVQALAPAPKGPPSSSYATSPAGLAAYASVLERAGHPVRRLRTRVAERAPRDGETLVVLDPDVMEPEEARAIGEWVRSGGRLVAGGSGDASWLEEVLDDPPVWEPDDADAAAHAGSGGGHVRRDRGAARSTAAAGTSSAARCPRSARPMGRCW